MDFGLSALLQRPAPLAWRQPGRSGGAERTHRLRGAGRAAARRRLAARGTRGTAGAAAGHRRVVAAHATLARLSSTDQWIALVSPPHVPYAPALAAAGLDLARIVIVRAGDGADTLWAMEQALGSGSCSAVIGWPSFVNERSLATAPARRGRRTRARAVLLRGASHQQFARGAAPAAHPHRRSPCACTC